MPVAYVVPPEVLSKFKEPFGTLIKGSFLETMANFKILVKKEKPTMIISVGDTVSRNLHLFHVVPQISITDNQSMRKRLDPHFFKGKGIVRVRNPQGVITQEAISVIQKTIRAAQHIHILVDGEEDLLTLVVVLNAPVNTIVVYGQPSKGIVVVKVTEAKRAEAQRIWSEMKAVEATS